VAKLLLLGPAREAAGTGHDEVEGATVRDVMRAACDRYGERFEAIVATSQIWVNRDVADETTRVGPHDEVAVLPPVSGGC